MQHIVFLEQYGSLGGGQQVLLELVRAALHIGCRVSVLIPDGPCVEKLRSIGAHVHKIADSHLSQGKKSFSDILRFIIYSWRIFLQYTGLLRSADLIYINGNRLLGTGMLAQYLLQRKAVCHIHLNHGQLEQKLFLLFLRNRKSLALIVPSPFILRQLQAAHQGFADARIRLLPNGLDSRFSNTPFEDRFTDRPLQHVGILGRVSPEKGQDILLPLAQRFPQLQFHVLGDAAFSGKDFYDRLKQVAPANIHFHGWIEDIPAKVREIGLQICLVPSRCPESFSLVSIEMTAISCLVIARKLGALEDVVCDLQLRIFSEDDELGDALERLINTSGIALAHEVENSYTLCKSKYDTTVFQKNLQNEISRLFLTNDIQTLQQ